MAKTVEKYLKLLSGRKVRHAKTKDVVIFYCAPQMEEFANFDFNIWRKRYIQWISHLKSRILDVFRSIDRDQDGRISQKEFTDYVLASSRACLPTIISLLMLMFHFVF